MITHAAARLVRRLRGPAHLAGQSWNSDSDPITGGANPMLAALAEGQRHFGRFLLLRVAGASAHGVVWVARDEAHAGLVALKFLPDALARDAALRAELKAIIEAVGALSADLFVPARELHEDGPRAAISTDLVDGNALGALREVRLNGCLDAAELLSWLEPFGAAFTEAHTRAHLVHAALHPGHLVLTPEGKVKVLDVALAHRLARAAEVHANGAGSRETRGFLHASPQLRRGAPPQPSDDIYALGATIYDLLAGGPPYSREQLDGAEPLAAPPPIRERRTAHDCWGAPVPPDWDEALAACLANDPAQRPDSIAALLERLRTGLLSEPKKTPGSIEEAPAVTTHEPSAPGPVNVTIAPPRPLTENLLAPEKATPPPTPTAPVAPPALLQLAPPVPVERTPPLPVASEHFSSKPPAAADPPQSREAILPSIEPAPSEPVDVVIHAAAPAVELSERASSVPEAAAQLVHSPSPGSGHVEAATAPPAVAVPSPPNENAELAAAAARISSEPPPQPSVAPVTTWSAPTGPITATLPEVDAARALSRQRAHHRAALVALACLSVIVQGARMFSERVLPPVLPAVHQPRLQQPPTTAAAAKVAERPLIADATAPNAVSAPPPSPAAKTARLESTVAPDPPTASPASPPAHAEPAGSVTPPRTGQRWTNSLGMLFTPVPKLPVLVAVWETRVRDYEAFAKATGATWQFSGDDGDREHPVVNVSYADAIRFCEWLTTTELAQGVLQPGQYYRFPTDLEWSAAAAVPTESGAMLRERDDPRDKLFAWGTQWPAPPSAGNFRGLNANTINTGGPAGAGDVFERTAPVGSFLPNRFGIFDLAGNAAEMVSDFIAPELGLHATRGGSFEDAGQRALRIRARGVGENERGRAPHIGFRIVVDPRVQTAP